MKTASHLPFTTPAATKPKREAKRAEISGDGGGGDANFQSGASSRRWRRRPLPREAKSAKHAARTPINLNAPCNGPTCTQTKFASQRFYSPSASTHEYTRLNQVHHRHVAKLNASGIDGVRRVWNNAMTVRAARRKRKGQGTFDASHSPSHSAEVLFLLAVALGDSCAVPEIRVMCSAN